MNKLYCNQIFLEASLATLSVQNKSYFQLKTLQKIQILLKDSSNQSQTSSDDFSFIPWSSFWNIYESSISAFSSFEGMRFWIFDADNSESIHEFLESYDISTKQFFSLIFWNRWIKRVTSIRHCFLFVFRWNRIFRARVEFVNCLNCLNCSNNKMPTSGLTSK